MEEADKLLIESLRLIKIEVKQLEEFDSPLFIKALIACFEHIAGMLSKEDNFIDVRFLKSQNLEESADKFRVCQKIQQYLKTLDYYNDISFNSFLFPNKKDTRKILAFLFEIMFKDDENEDEKNKQPTNTYEVIFKRRLTKFRAKPWIVPEFLKIQKPMFVGSGDTIVVARGLDAKRVANCKSKKVKGVYDMMNALTAQGGKSHVTAYQGGMSLSLQINNSTWTRGQKVLTKKKNDYFSRDEEDQNQKAQKMNKNEILLSFQQAIQVAVQGQQSATGGNAAVSAETKSLFEMITDRDNQITKLNEMQDIQNSEMIEALTQDVATAGTSSSVMSHVLQQSIISEST